MAKKAVIATGGKQYVVTEGDTIAVESLKTDAKTIDFDALLVIDGDKVSVGTPLVKGAKVSAEIVSTEARADKVTSIRYKAKKRVHTLHGHKQHLNTLTITKIV